MQTFLPYPNFTQSVRVLDRQRLGKQRVETKQILMCLLGTGSLRWANHPAVKMWRDYEHDLTVYGMSVCMEWRQRGYKDTCLDYFIDTYVQVFTSPRHSLADIPPWIGDSAFHASHRSNLLRKDPIHYGQFGWAESPDMPYVWPV